MKFKKDAKKVFTTDTYYDLFDGGYIDPEDMLEKDHGKIVREAMGIITQFLEEAEENGCLELG